MTLTPLQLREHGKELLKTYKNGQRLEVALHQTCMQLPADKYLDAYQDNLLHLLTLLQTNTDPTSLLQQGKTGWDSVLFQPFLEAERRDIVNLTKPLEVEEGLYTCPKCKSKKTHSYTRQVRSADEPATTFITCANTDCSYKWKIG